MNALRRRSVSAFFKIVKKLLDIWRLYKYFIFMEFEKAYVMIYRDTLWQPLKVSLVGMKLLKAERSFTYR